MHCYVERLSGMLVGLPRCHVRTVIGYDALRYIALERRERSKVGVVTVTAVKIFKNPC